MPPTEVTRGLPTGTVTFLFTDIEGSTRRWEQEPDAMSKALALHDDLLRRAVEDNSGQVYEHTGDGMVAAFHHAPDGVAAALTSQRSLAKASWPEETGPLRVRMGLHTGPGVLHRDRYLNQPLNRCARLMAAAHGGQVVVSEATAALVRTLLPPEGSLLDLGEYALRDLAEPVRVYQLVHPDLQRDFPPLRSLEWFRGNLPSQRSSFVGRTRELAEVRAALGRSRLVTLTGVGGVGKTRLALQVAAEALPAYPDGCWLCELASAADGDATVRIVASALDVTPRQGMSLQESIVDWARPKRLLLVLDNCEQVLEPAARLADALLRACPRVSILATSRQSLSLDGEQVWTLDPLPLPAPTASVEEVRASDAAELFVERALAARPQFVLDEGNASSVAEIARRLDGIPLAIELAAARVAALGSQEIADRLDERFRLLTVGRRTAEPRQQTLRGAVDWSYSLLTDAERTTFADLGVFAGTFDAAAAAAVVGGDELDVVDILASLVTKSMVVRERSVAGTARYRLLETLRHYALERLAEPGDLELRHRHAAWYAELAERMGPALLGADELSWRPRLHAELDNLRAAVTWALSNSAAEMQFAVRIAAALAPYAVFEGAGDIADIAERVAVHLEIATDRQRKTILAAVAFHAFQNKGDVSRAGELADAALAGDVGDNPSPARAYAAKAMAMAFGGRTNAATAILLDAANELERVGAHPFERAWLLQTMAATRLMGGDLAAARAAAEGALPLAREVGNPSELAAALWSIGITSAVDDPDRAMAAADESIAIVRAGASGASFGHTLALRAQLRAQADDVRGGLVDLREALSYSYDKGDRVMLMVGFDRGVTVLAAAADDEGAGRLLGVATESSLAPLSILSAPEREARAALADELRQRMGVAAYGAAIAAGAAMTADEATADVLTRINALTTASPRLRPGERRATAS